MNNTVAVFADGHTVKGRTADFTPQKDVFHLKDVAAPPAALPLEIHMQELKALFFVKDLSEKPQPGKLLQPHPTLPAAGRRLRVIFKDGQVMVGTSADYHAGRQGFFIQPANADTNVIRCYVVTTATREIATVP